MALHEDQSNYSVSSANIYSRLAASEKMLSAFGPFYATSYRVLRLDPPRGLSRGYLLEIPYSQLASVELVRRANHQMLALGTAMIILGLFILPIMPISAALTLPIGGGILYLGARGKPGYYQLMAHDMPQQAEKYWQVEYNRSGNFIATVRSVIGQMPDF
ncbi:MAG TPA: hypothetical protein VFR55_08135 [Dehalococcoidia bacterium]|nr:hypothetical protein [Dehalococcoidia bacterium]